MKNKFYKIIFLVIIFIFMINIINSYAANHWNDFSVNDYKNATPENAGQLAGYLSAEDEESLKGLEKDELEKYIKCSEAFLKTEAARQLDISITGKINTYKEEAKKIKKEGTGNNDEKEGGSSNINNSSWTDYISRKNEVKNVATKEDAETFYKMLANPNPSIDDMSDDYAEQYIILIGELLKSPGFQLYSDEKTNARQVLTERMRLAKDKHEIDDEDASETLGDTGADTDAGGQGGSDTAVYKQPKKGDTKTAATSLGDVIEDGDSLIREGKELQYNEAGLQKFSTIMYNILLAIAVALALIVGVIVGIKYMTGSVEEKANYKAMFLPYVVGCVVVFGSFGIWKLVVGILQNI